MAFKEGRFARQSWQLGALGDRDYHGFETFNRAGGLKYPGPFEGISTSLARPQNKEGIAVSRDVVICDLKGVTDFYIQFAR